MNTAFVIGNGESRNIFPIEHLKDKGVIWGCNAIYRDYPLLCDKIVAVNPPMYEELKEWHNTTDQKIKIHGPEDLVNWNWIIEGDQENDIPKGLKLYRIWRGGNIKNGGKIRTLDFSLARGSGCSAVLLAADSGVKNVVILGFDILGSRQWEYAVKDGSSSREQNNIYKNTENYPSRISMKAYLKYEWMYHLRQTLRKYPKTNFYFINRKEYLEYNPFLKYYFDQPNIQVGTYGDLERWLSDNIDQIKWRRL
jgi:hypothetical protein